jgi:YHS domain-containing protein
MKYLVYTLVFVFALSFTSCATRVVVKQPVSVTVVKKLPRQYKVVRVKGKRYYFFNGKHYRKTRNGYVIVRV